MCAYRSERCAESGVCVVRALVQARAQAVLQTLEAQALNTTGQGSVAPEDMLQGIHPHTGQAQNDRGTVEKSHGILSLKWCYSCCAQTSWFQIAAVRRRHGFRQLLCTDVMVPDSGLISLEISTANWSIN